MKLVLWDWNGTLINDVQACIDAMNVLLGRRNMPAVNKQTYRRIFTFPVIEYYKRLGFDLNIESFDALVKEYIEQYNVFSKQAALFPKSRMVLDYCRSTGHRQSILSAMAQSELLKQIEANKVLDYFHDVVGLKNIFAESKIHNAKNYIQIGRINKDDVLFVGDTYHDYEVSNNIGCKCILVSNGHQDLNQNMVPGAILLKDIGEICDKIA